ncbi:MAG: dicarboxylate/amino acid:cation symporter [Vicinamibacterales bacterium]
MSAAYVMIGLGAGLLLGALASISGSPGLAAVIAVLEPLGTVFVHAIRMAVIPLVAASLIVGVASTTDARALARLGGRGLALFVVVVVTATAATATIAAPLLSRVPFDPAVVAALREGAPADTADGAETARSLPGVAQWVVDLVPANPIKAAADGAMLPLIVFTIGFAIALTRLSSDSRALLVGIFRAIADAMMILVRGVLLLAPIGVFALAAPLAARLGIAAAGALLYYVLLAVGLTLAFVALVLYPATAVMGGISLRRFARACAPAQAVAFSSRSTMASLPAMIAAAKALEVPEHVTAFVVPLAASIFRVGSAVGQTVGVLFAAQLYGATPNATQLATIVMTVVLTTFTVPGIPGGSIVVMVPILVAANLPVEGIGLLLGVDTIPDMFRTTANVTGGISAAAILGRPARRAAAGKELASV